MKKLIIFFASVYLLFGASNDEAELKKMIGQMIMIGFSHSSANDSWTDQLVLDAGFGRIGGVMLLARNISTKDELIKLTKKLSSSKSKHKLLIAIDEEGGKVSRFINKDGFKHFPSAYEVGSKMNLNKAGIIYKDMADQLKNLGINMNFAPVVDVYNPNSSIIGQKNRAFSKNPDEVIAYSSEFIKSFDKANIKTVLKHFPGHGNAIKDTHKEKTVVDNYDFDELKPYFELIKRGQASFIMVAHVYIPNLDDKNPAVLSKHIVSDILKNRFKFKGAVVSDDLLMKGLGELSIEQKVVRAINAGVDIVLVSEYFLNNSNSIKIINDAILNAVNSGKISKERIKDAYTRILRSKEGL
ncbi:glycoside hydrolase family 3 N-terminal domain-containing protein [Campylobacter fetus]|uniref:glycoside hydrolase family 3 N-terminal domain-containing protein n=1 Tax=Campylobacter fetus TaxID=196 RepID=UPI00081879AF|nr:glycoside hydrolase family 3 N-terminal domain-containing protein [Campylobacter fetus]EAH8299530.1 glycoside hydrolase family 3 protein [Campylobacter fetus]EAI7232128.1 glycoside hydrolase family 3 protein [Campylobacter fetus]EAJ5690654.1 glycoside hydrolase family 3 protein [Campylobacter fetus]EAK0427635.1 glycoside hydrolase family 3 protein [Campylobacter fetus]EAK5304584.1 glycoside hydrolase family 3 protein [Campylobacter fetus]